MKERVLLASLVITSLLVTASQAQVAQLGRMPLKGKIKQTAGLLTGLFNSGGGCDAGCAGCSDPGCGAVAPSCGCAALEPGCGLASAPGCGLPQATCGAAAPTCGLAGRLLGGLGGGPTCGLPEPACGATGLGYGGGFGLCGGCNGGSGCDTCGVGGYFGRNLHQVNPCACGGSLFGDMARGFLGFFDNAVGSLVGGFFGGMQMASSHASGTFAALQSAACCGLCGGGGCDGGCAGLPTGGCSSPLGCSSCSAGPTCGVATVSQGYVAQSNSYPVESYPTNSYPTNSYPTESYSTESYPVNSYPSAPATNSYLPQPAPPVANPPLLDAMPIDASPIQSPTPAIDPFTDDPTPLTQGRRIVQPQQRAVATGYRLFKGGNPHATQQPQIRQAQGYQFAKQQPRANMIGAAVEQATGQVKSTAASSAAPLQHRYLQAQGRAASLRR